MDQREQYFFSEAVTHARALPYAQCLQFLQGMLLAVGEHPSAEALRLTVQQMALNDAQLELIALGQLRFDMDSIRPAKPAHPGTQSEVSP